MDETNSAVKDFFGWVVAIGVAVVIGLFMHIFVIEAFVVDGASMEPTFYSNDRIILWKSAYLFSEPKRGDIIVFRYPSDPSRDFIKRVIGTPGDTVEIKNGYVFINGREIEEKYINTFPLNNFSARKVPPRSYFVLGDNRNNSMDSRDENVGFVPRSYIVGKAEFVFYPLDDLHIIHDQNYLLKRKK